MSGVWTRWNVPTFRRAARAAEAPGVIRSAGRRPRPGAVFPPTTATPTTDSASFASRVTRSTFV